jgi:hypothetical protein
MIKLLIIFLGALALRALADNPVPKDQSNTPIYSGTGKPVFSEAVTLTSGTYAGLLTLPTTGENGSRHWKGIAVYNPSTTRSVYICIGAAATCSVDAMKIPSSTGIALDQVYFGPINDVVKIWGKLDAPGSVVPELTVW